MRDTGASDTLTVGASTEIRGQGSEFGEQKLGLLQMTADH
jgi:hypothetical protein